MSKIYDSLRSIILPLGEISEHLPNKGQIIDLGCGQGVITRYIAKRKDRKVIGVDLDLKRLPKISQKNLKFIKSDIRNYEINNADGVIISDVLHHINFADQKKVLKRIAVNLEKTGTLIIKEIDSNEFIRAKLSRIWDFLLYPSDKIAYTNSISLKNFLKKLGFKVKIIRPCRFFPGSTTLYVCTK